MVIADVPHRVGKDDLFELALLPPLVVGSEEVRKQFKSSFSVSQIDTLIVGITVPLTAPRRQFCAQAFALDALGVNDDDGMDGSVVACSGILDDLYVADEVRLDVTKLVQVVQLSVVHIDERSTLAQYFVAITFL